MTALAFGAAPEAAAHPRATSLSSWEFENARDGVAATVVVRVPWAALQQVLPELSGLMPEGLGYRVDGMTAVDAYLREHVHLEAGGEACRMRGGMQGVPSADTTHFARRFRLNCGPGEPRIEVDLFHEINASHLHLARARLPDGGDHDRVMVVGQSVWWPQRMAAGGEGEHQASSIGDYLALGIEHIATGYDHLVFVLALLLTGTGVAQLATVVTGFTVAHSLTLALGVFGLAQPLPEAVEALIGFSIIVVACENFSATLGATARRALYGGLAVLIVSVVAASLVGATGLPALALIGIGLFSLSYLGLSERTTRPGALRWGVACAFGLVHGFGFAGVLTEAELPVENLAPALLGFNLGVEIGQLVVVAVGWLLLRAWLTGPTPRRVATIQWGTTPVLAAGLYWFLSRALTG